MAIQDTRQKTIASLVWFGLGQVLIIALIAISIWAKKRSIHEFNTLIYHRTKLSDTMLLHRAAQAVSRELENDPISQAYLASHPVFISMTTSPSRIDKVASIIEALDLSLVESVWINIPQVFARTGERYQIPDALVHIPKVRIHEIDQDYGPATKFLPGVMRARKLDSKAIVISLDDDHAYPKSIVAEHVYAVAHGAKVSNIIDARAGDLANGFFALPKDDPNLHAAWPSQDYTLIHGWSSVAYVAEVVPVAKIITWLQQEHEAQVEDNNCLFSDDFLITYALASEQVPITTVQTDYAQFTDIFPLSYGLADDALHRQKLAHERDWQLDKMNDFTKYRLEKCFAFLLEKNSGH